MASFSTEDRTIQSATNTVQEFSRAERLQQLERIVASNHFRNSKRYPSFLRYVVEHTVEEDSEVLKERNLGVEIFGRAGDYDTNSDPIVRVTAGEVRKRIAQYYQMPGHENELRIDLPLGSYVPHFYPASQAPAAIEHETPTALVQSQELHAESAENEITLPEPSKASRRSLKRWILRRRPMVVLVLLTIIVLFSLSAVGLAGLLRKRSQESGSRYFWKPFTSAGKMALIVIGVHSLDTYGKAVSTDTHVNATRDARQSALSTMEDSDMVPLSDLVSYSKLTDLLTRNKLDYRTEGSSATTLEELRSGPVIFLGGFNNLWTMRLTSALPYRFVPKGNNINGIEDSRDPSRLWLFDNLQPALSNSRDYAIVASYFDTTIEQHVVIAAGIGKNGTVAAAEFLTTEKYLEDWFEEAKVPKNKNIELVLSTDVLDGEPGPPHVIAFTAW